MVLKCVLPKYKKVLVERDAVILVDFSAIKSPCKPLFIDIISAVTFNKS